MRGPGLFTRREAYEAIELAEMIARDEGGLR
jgi:hypothetical protein